MKRFALFAAISVAVFFCLAGISSAQAIENEFYLITPVSKDVHDPVLKAFAAYAKKRWNVDLKTSAMPQGTPVAYGQILEWKGKPRADVFWGGEGTLFDNLAREGLLEKVQVPDKMWNEIPAEIGKPVGLPLKDPKKFWVGTMLEPYRDHLPAETPQAPWRGDQGLGRPPEPQAERPDRPVHTGPLKQQPRFL